MAGATGIDTTELRLRTILDRVDGWLRHAETKNAGLIALSGTANAAVLAFARPLSDLAPVVLVGITCSQVAFLLAIVIGIASFLPQTRLAPLVENGRASADGGGNLFFYGHLAARTPAQLAADVAALDDGDAPAAVRRVHVMLAEQIVANSRITARKLRLFGWAAAAAVAGAAFLALALSARLLMSGAAT